MPKHIVSKVLEELLGEYVLNISKENLKVGILRGKVKLDNVQLDGDLIGSHILGAVGLSGFGVLSCWAHKFRITVPWSALEKEPTRIEIRGMHLLCVPLLPSTALLQFGSGTVSDPRCSLRTRVKRSALARFERNFFAGRIPGEGPSLEVKIYRSSSADDDGIKSDDSNNGDTMDSVLDDSAQSSSDKKKKNTDTEASKKSTGIRAWRTKLRLKVVKNTEASIKDLHIRCEVPENALHNDSNILFRNRRKKTNMHVNDGMPAERRPFSFGFTLESVIVKSATSSWETGNIKESLDSSTRSKGIKMKNKSVEDDSPSDNTKYKVFEVNKMAMYWDDKVPFLISDFILSNGSGLCINQYQMQSNIVSAMDSLITSKEPGAFIRNSFLENPQKNVAMNTKSSKHQFLCDPFSLVFRASFKDGTLNQPSVCIADLLPCEIRLNMQPQQQLQYSKLKTAMYAQQRLDTMLHQRPTQKPSRGSKESKAWWKYIIACVVTRPNTRPWRDVQRIVHARPKYIELVLKKYLFALDVDGSTNKLTDDENAELLSLEDLLPIEALLAFHLLALRIIATTRAFEISQHESKKRSNYRNSYSKAPRRLLNLNRFRRSFGGKVMKGKEGSETLNDEMHDQLLPNILSRNMNDGSTEFLLQMQSADQKKNESKPMQMNFKLHNMTIIYTMLDKTFGKPIIKVELQTQGFSRTSNTSQNEIILNINRFHVLDCIEPLKNNSQNDIFQFSRILFVQAPVDSKDSGEDETHLPTNATRTKRFSNAIFKKRRKSNSKDEHNLNSTFDQFKSSHLPPGVLCQIHAHRDLQSLSLAVLAHPAIMVWNQVCIDAISDFFSSAAQENQSILTGHLRNAATPLAHKAQLAIMSPLSISIDINMNAPKLWVPVSQRRTDGALYLDAGFIQMSMSNKEHSRETNWEVEVSDIQVKFNRVMLESHESNDQLQSFMIPQGKNELNEVINIISPFNIGLFASTTEKVADGLQHNANDNFFKHLNITSSEQNTILHNAGYTSKLDVIVGNIAINLVDVDTLAKAIGRWFAIGLAKRTHLQKKSSTMQISPHSSSKLFRKQYFDENGKQIHHLATSQKQHKPSFQINLSIEKIGMELESISKVTALYSKKYRKQLGRTYEICIIGVSMQRKRSNDITISQFLLDDLYILQRTNTARIPCLSQNSDTSKNVDTRHMILARRPDTKGQSYSSLKNSANSLDELLHSYPHEEHGDTAHKDSYRNRRFGSDDNFDDSNLKGKNVILQAFHLHDRRHHSDEIEINISSIIMRVTPTSLRDSLRCSRRILELIQVMTKSMEMKVHEKGRKDRLKGDLSTQRVQSGREQVLDRKLNNLTGNNINKGSDSTILFKVTLNETIILTGTSSDNSNVVRYQKSGKEINVDCSSTQDSNDTVLQILSTALIMFQSNEDVYGSGTKTLHASIENLSASLIAEFEPMFFSQVSSILSPMSADFRVVYITENRGVTVSQEFNIDCEAVKSKMTFNDVKSVMRIVRELQNGLRTMNTILPESVEAQKSVKFEKMKRKKISQKKKKFISILHSKKKGSGIATRIRFEIQNISITFLRAYQFKNSGRPIFDFHSNPTKGKFHGCASAMSGEMNAYVSINFFNALNSEWEYVVEPILIVIAIENLPSEFNVSVASPDVIKMNLTGVFLSDFVETGFTFFNSKHKIKEKNNNFNSYDRSFESQNKYMTEKSSPSLFSHSINICNDTGFDILLCPIKNSAFTPLTSSEMRINPDVIIVANDNSVALDSFFNNENFKKLLNQSQNNILHFALALSSTAEELIGERAPICNLPITTSSGYSSKMYKLLPINLRRIKDTSQGRSTQLNIFNPETTSSKNTTLNQDVLHSNYQYEPVVEWCIQNQRLRASTVDVYSIMKGKDLLSSQIWSPSDEIYLDMGQTNHDNGTQKEVNENNRSSFDSEDDFEDSVNSTRSTVTGSWLRPFLKSDVPEWTDMTYVLRLARERVMLPDPNWIWVNNWTIDKSGEYHETTDGDGWEYGVDFPEFNRSRRFYKRGDQCRRRRWTRTRIVKPPPLYDHLRPISLVWETKRDEDGNYLLRVRSHLTVHNCTSIKLSCFAFSYSWESDQFVASISPGEEKSVPILLASATYLRIGIKHACEDEPELNNEESIACYSVSERLMILPPSYNSSVLLRTTIRCRKNKKKSTPSSIINLLVRIKCKKCITEIFLEPVLLVVNLLPCQLQCKLGELQRQEKRRKINGLHDQNKARIKEREAVSIETSEDAKISSVHPAAKPHLSLRLPGYKWSSWSRIVNRGKNTDTWFPNEREELNIFQGNEGDLDHTTEYKSIVQLERLRKGGDPLVIILGVEAGHFPTLRIWAQYWIIDKTGFGLQFADAFTGLLGGTPTGDSHRRSYALSSEEKHKGIKEDFCLTGHQWSIGMSGMSLYFSRKEKIAVRIESGAGNEVHGKAQIKSNWSTFLDISNVMPKTVFSLEENGGPRRFELALNVSLCPSIFSRTKLITIFPKYQIVNLLNETIFVAQDKCLQSETSIPSQTSVPFHWEVSSLAPSVRLSVARDTNYSPHTSIDWMWTNGCIRLDKIGITSMRIPTRGRAQTPMVIQVEVRLATPQQSSAVVIVIWSTTARSNPLYLLRNQSSYTILCSQQIDEDNRHITNNIETDNSSYESLSHNNFLASKSTRELDGIGALSETLQCHNNIFQNEQRFEKKIECSAFGPLIGDLFVADQKQEYIWRLPRNEVRCFGFEDPEKPHLLRWTCVDVKQLSSGRNENFVASLEVDSMGSSSILSLLDGNQIMCQIKAEHSTKVIEFSDFVLNSPSKTLSPSLSILRESETFQVDETELQLDNDVDEDFISLNFRLHLLGFGLSVVDNASDLVFGREILYFQADSLFVEFSQSREGYHEIELRLMTLQMDNHVAKTAHPVLIFCPRVNKNEPFLHLSAVRRLHLHSSTYVFRYAALRMLDIDIFIDRSTAETIAQFLQPLRKVRYEQKHDNPFQWVVTLTSTMTSKYSEPNRRAPRDIEKMASTANTGRIYFEQLHLHPIRFSLTFTQEWKKWNPASEDLVIFQFIRGMASIAGAPLTFTSFVVNHAFEAPQAFGRIIAAHYSSQLTKQVFGILGSLAILGAPADFLANVGTGVRDFFYEPINGIIHGPKQFIQGLEAGTQSLARGLVVGVARGAANVTDAVNSNLAGLAADDDFVNERAAHRRMLTDALSRGMANRTVGESLYLAGASVARGVRSGAKGIVEQPTRYASQHGPGGLIQGVGRALVGAIIKPVVGIGDAAVLMMNHVSEATSDKVLLLRIPKRLRRALPRISMGNGSKSVRLVPYDEKAAKAQKIVSSDECVEDTYIGHINTSTHLIIASEESLWAIDRKSRKPMCFSWEEISHFTILQDGAIRVSIFSHVGLKPFTIQVENSASFEALLRLLSMQVAKMGNCPSHFANSENVSFSDGTKYNSNDCVPGIKTKQMNHIFGCLNAIRTPINLMAKDDIEVIEQCYARVKQLGSELPIFFKSLDEEAWNLINSWGQVYSGLSSRRCLSAGFINGTGCIMQVKSTMLVEGGSPCYAIPSKEYDQEQGILHPGGAIIIFGWGAVPSLSQAGRVFMNIETSAFICDLTDHKSKATHAVALPGFEVGFLEKSYDDSGWWAKYWLIVRKAQ